MKDESASVQTSGNTLAVTLPITFKTGFAGFKGVWMAGKRWQGRSFCGRRLGPGVHRDISSVFLAHCGLSQGLTTCSIA